MSVLPENWHTWYLGGADSASGLSFLKFRPQNPFLGKFRPKHSKLFVLPENLHSWYIGDADSESRLRISKFRTQNPFLGKYGSKNSKKWYTKYFEDADSYSNTSFLNFQLKIHFWIELGPGSGIACFVWCWHTWHIRVAD